MDDLEAERVIVVQAGGGTCALRIQDVVETMRPRDVRALAGAPAFVTGAALVRGAPTPVVDLAAFLGGERERAPGRWVTVRCGGRTAALAVRRVLGVAPLPQAFASAPLLDRAAAGAVESLRALDGELLLVLAAGRLVATDVLRTAAESA